MSKPLWLLVLLAVLCLLAPACVPVPAPLPPSPALQIAGPVAGGGAVVAAAPMPDADDGGPVPVSAADPSWGQPDALVTIVEFGDFQCPFCGRVEQTLTRLRGVYGPERLRVVWKNNPLPFHAQARPAAAVAMMMFQRAGNDGFWSAHAALFAGQLRLDEVTGELAARAWGPDGDRQAALSDADAKVAADMKLAARVGASGTPAFFVNGVYLSGAQPFERFATIVDEQVQRAQTLIARGTPRRRVYAELSREERQKPAAPPKPEDRAIHRVPVGNSPARGSAAALVTIVEIADFQCPFCGRVEPTLRQVLAAYGEQVRLVWKHNPLPFHLRAEPAAELTLEARAQKGDKGFWAAHDLLFKKECKGQPAAADKTTCETGGGTWIDNQMRLADADLLAYAGALGLDAARVSAAITGKKHHAVLEADQDLADDEEANGTPHFFINGRRLVGAHPFEKLKGTIDEELAKAEALVKGGVPAARVYERIQAAAAAPAPPERKTVPPPTRDNPSRGPAGAKVVVQLFGDFQCPFCKRVLPTVEELEKALPGKIRVVWRNRPLSVHPDAGLAAEAAMEAFEQRGDKGFWAMLALLYAAQGPAGALDRASLERYAVELGLDPARFARALDTHAHQAAIDADSKIADAAGISGTPAFVINGYLVIGAQSLAKFVRVAKRALAEK